MNIKDLDLVGQNKIFIKEKFGHGYNYFPSSSWTYEIKKNWIGRRTLLIFDFDEDIVIKVFIKRTFKK